LEISVPTSEQKVFDITFHSLYNDVKCREVKRVSVRKSITMTDEMAKYFEDKSKLTGVSESSLIILAISDYLERLKKNDEKK